MPGQNPYLGLLNISNVPQWNWDKLTLRSNAKYPPQMMTILHMFRWTESEPFKQDGSYSRLEWPIIICVRAIYKKFMHILQITDVLKSTTTITMLLMSRQPSCIYNIRDTWTSICQHNENDVKQNWGMSIRRVNISRVKNMFCLDIFNGSWVKSNQSWMYIAKYTIVCFHGHLF